MANSKQQDNQAADLVSFKILLNGSQMNQAWHVLSLELYHHFNKIATARIIIADGDVGLQDFPLSGKDELLPGTAIEIQMGYHEQLRTLFKGIIVKHGIQSKRSRRSFLQIEAKDQFMKLAIARKNYSFLNKTDADIIKQLAENAGFAKADFDVASTSVTHASMVQYNVTDWDFIVSRAEMNSMLVHTQNNKLIVQKPDTSQKPIKEIAYGKEVIEFEFETDGRTQRVEATTRSWDYSDQAVLENETATTAFADNGTPSGKDLAEKLGLKKYELFHPGHLKKDELQLWGKSQLMKSRMAKNIGRIRIRGANDVSAGNVAVLSGFGKRFNGKVLVTGVRHTYRETIWETDIYFGLPENWFYEKDEIIQKPASGMVPGIHGLHIGIVTQLENDPEKEDRIRIKLPMVNGDESIWARIASLDAGNERGAFFRPEIKDEVIVGFLNGDPRHPIVLGMLHSSAMPAPVKAADANHEKGFITRSKLKFFFNDQKKSISIETPKGKKITIDEDKNIIVVADENGNKIEMCTDGIKLESAKDITLKTAAGAIKLDAKDIKLNAAAKLTANGNGAADLTSSGQTIVKGAVVNIN